MAGNKKMSKRRVQMPLHVIFGDVVSSSFFGRNKFSIITLIALVIFYIAIKYECQTRMETISKLENDLAIIKSESIREQSLYRSRTRESMMQELVDSMHLGLSVQDQPPYRISY